MLPSYIDARLTVNERDEKWNFQGTLPGQIYHLGCAANKTAGIPQGTVLVKVAIIADCNISVGSDVFMSDVVIASRNGGNPGNGGGSAGVSNANISFSSNVVLGMPDNCLPGGGVQIFSDASVHFSSTMLMNGVQIVAAGDVDLGARDMGINGINVQTGGNTTLTSNNMFGLCSGGAPALFTVGYYRLVQ